MKPVARIIGVTLGLVGAFAVAAAGLRVAHAGQAQTSAQLAGAFPKAAAKALAAAHDPHRPAAGLPAEAAPAAVLARAQSAAAKGDLQLALCDIVALPPESRAAITPWREAAQRRVALDQAPKASSALGAPPAHR